MKPTQPDATEVEQNWAQQGEEIIPLGMRGSGRAEADIRAALIAAVFGGDAAQLQRPGLRERLAERFVHAVRGCSLMRLSVFDRPSGRLIQVGWMCPCGKEFSIGDGAVTGKRHG